MYKFINPYNFIPMGKEKSKAKEEDGEELVSGVIRYSVLTKTPLFIPNTSCDNFYGGPKEHKSYPFYSYVDYSDLKREKKSITDPEPVIPGSEIRGMFRSNFEILTNSCMSALDSDMKLSKRILESYNAGLLKRVVRGGKVQYNLYRAQDVLWRTKGENNTSDDLNWKDDWKHRQRRCYIQKNFPEGSCVSFVMHKRYDRRGREIKPLASNVKPFFDIEKGKKYGFIIKGEAGPRKHCCHIFAPISPEKSLVEEDIETSLLLLDDVLQVYASNKLDNASFYEEYRKKYDEFKKGKGCMYFPVYYSKITDDNKKKLFLAPACKTREIYDNTLRNLAGKLAPCTSKGGFCEACKLFGTVTADGESKSSKLRFTDLRVEKKMETKKYYCKKQITLPELSSPKLNNMEFYLKRPEDKAQFWTYDYYVDANGELHIRPGELAGRKFYWHQNLDDNYNPKETKGKRNITIKPVRTGLAFSGKVYFDKITKETLNKLLYLIDSGEDEPEIEKKEHGYN